jgi:hypothetical protein
MSIQAVLYSNSSERGADRLPVSRASTLRTEQDKPVDVLIEDVSAGGFRLRGPIGFESGQSVRIGLPGIGIRTAQVVWTGQGAAGCMLDQGLSADDLRTVLTFEGAVVEGAFPSFAAAEEDAYRSPYSPRRRLAMIVGAAAGSWVLVLGMVALARGVASL